MRGMKPRFAIRDLLALTAYIAIAIWLFKMAFSTLPPTNILCWVFAVVFTGGAFIYLVMMTTGVK